MSYAVTCCISNTAIIEGDKCVMVILNKGFPLTFNAFFKRVHLQCEREGRYKTSELFDYENGTDLGYYIPVKTVVIGTYNDYGCIKEKSRLPKSIDESMYPFNALFFHCWAIEFLFKDKIKNLIKDKVGFVATLLSKLHNLRRNPLDLIMVGDAYEFKENIEAQIALNNRIGEYLKDCLGKERFCKK